ncbi:MAG: lipopolysaccharide kinase InaA family protein [Ilumatobacter sp.]|uniref:hypothetical protein n=1 Tax=Ilumatobacter sp. TaxID=1967498 RepID=UPI003C73580B
MRKRPMGGPPPLPRSINPATKVGLAAFGAAVLLIAFSTQPSIRDYLWTPELEFMETVAASRVDWLTSVLQPIWNVSYDYAVPLLIWPALIVLIATRRFRSAVTFFVSFLLVVLVVSVLQDLIVRPRPLGVEILGDWEGFSHPDRKMATLTAAITAMILHSIPHGNVRRTVKVVGGVTVGVLGIAAVYLGVATPSSITAAMAIGFSITQVMFRTLTPPEVFPVQLRKGNTAHLAMTPERVAAIKAGIADQLDIAIESARPIALDGSAGSTPLLLDVADRADLPPRLFAKLYAQSHLRSDRLYKIGRTLLYGQLEDEVAFNSVRRLVEYEDYLSNKMAQTVPTARSLGVVELTPEREYVVVFEFLDGARELGDVIDAGELTVELIDDGIAVVDRLWRAGLAHRDIKPSNLMVTGDGRLSVIDVAFGQVRPTRWRQSVDLGNMLLLLALGSTAETVVSRALVRFSPDEIADALAAARSVAVPGQLAGELKSASRDVAAELKALVPHRNPIGLQRWSLTRLTLAVSVVASALLTFTLFASSARLAGLLP